jgi:cytochrome-b5 reductase
MSRFLAFSAAAAAGSFFGLSRSATAQCAVAAAAAPADDGEEAPARSPFAPKYDKAKLKNFQGNAIGYNFTSMKLGEVINLTSETAIFRFLLPNADDVYHLTPCSTLQVQDRHGSNMVEQVQRMYTPITPNGTKGYFDLVVKKQRHGRMTEHLFAMEAGDSLLFRIVDYKFQYQKNLYEHIGMIGAGSGITPLLQVIRGALQHDDDNTKLSLLFANPNQKRILLKGVIDELAAGSNGRFTPHYIVDKVLDDEPWDGLTGLIEKDAIKRTMPPPNDANLLMVCGSDRLMNHLCGLPWHVMKLWSNGQAKQPATSNANNMGELGGLLRDMGYHSERVYRF